MVSATTWATRSPCFTTPMLRTSLGIRFRSFHLLKPLAVVFPLPTTWMHLIQLLAVGIGLAPHHLKLPSPALRAALASVT